MKDTFNRLKRIMPVLAATFLMSGAGAFASQAQNFEDTDKTQPFLDNKPTMSMFSVSKIIKKYIVFLLLMVCAVVSEKNTVFGGESTVEGIYYNDINGQSDDTLKKRLEVTRLYYDYVYEDCNGTPQLSCEDFLKQKESHIYNSYTPEQRKPFTSLTPDQLNGITISVKYSEHHHDGNADDDHDYDDYDEDISHVRTYYKSDTWKTDGEHRGEHEYTEWRKNGKKEKKYTYSTALQYTYTSQYSHSKETSNTYQYYYLNPNATFYGEGFGYHGRFSWHLSVTKNGNNVPYKSYTYSSGSRYSSPEVYLFIEAHTWEWTHDDNYHWQKCKDCNATQKRGSHTDSNNDGKCDTCGYLMQRTVEFNGNSGTTPNPATVTVKYNTAINTAIQSMPSSTRTGYNFLGWFTATTGGTQVTSDTKIADNITVYAHWSARIYQIRYIMHGFTLNNPVTKYTIEDTITIPELTSPAPSKKEFRKWISYEAGAGDLMPGCKNIGYKNNIMTIPKGTYGNLTFEVDWKPVGDGISSSEPVINHFKIKMN